jgi:hypothetical protein
MRVRVFYLWLFTAAVLGSVSAPASASEVAIPRDLARDARLEAPLAVAVKDRPLGEVLPELGKKLNVHLSAARETADDKITLFIQERPAREVLALISDHFDFQWRRERDGYRLGQSLAARNRQAAAREAQDAAEIAALRRKLERIAALGAVTPEAAQARQEEVRPLLGSPGLSSAEQQQVIEELQAWQQAANPLTPPVISVLARLPPQQQARLWQGEVLEFSNQDRSLPSNIADEVHRAMSQGPNQGAPDFSDASMRVYIGRSPRDQNTVLTTENRSYSLNASVTVQGANGGRGTGWSITAMPVHIYPPDEQVSDDPGLRQVVELPPLSPRRSPRHRLLQGLGVRWPEARSLGDILEALHEQTDLDFLSDSFTRQRFGPPFDRTVVQRQPVSRLLSILRGERGHEWWKQGSLVRLRSQKYVFDRIEEAPSAALDAFREAAEREGEATLDDFAALAMRLTDPQVESLHSCWMWYFAQSGPPPLRGSAGLYGSRNFLRWWATLLPPQRAALAQPGGLGVVDLAPPQQQLLLAALSDPHGRRFGRGSFRAEAFPSLRVQLRGETKEWEVFGNAGDVINNTSRRPRDSNAPPPDNLLLLGPPVVERAYHFTLPQERGPLSGLAFTFQIIQIPEIPDERP